MVLIRKVKKSDKAQLLRLAREFHNDSYMNRKIVPQPLFNLSRFLDYDLVILENVAKYLRAKPPNGMTFVAEANEQLVGYIYGFVKVRPKKVFNRMGYVEDWFVTKRHRGKGTGKLLWNALIVWFKKQKCNCIELDVSYRNKIGRRIYKKLGLMEKMISLGKKL